MRSSHWSFLFSVALLLSFCSAAAAAEPAKPRVIVTTDGEVDDMDSFIRFLLYANEFKIEGLVYSSSQWHYAGDGRGTLFTSQMPGTARRRRVSTTLRHQAMRFSDFSPLSLAVY